MVIPVKNCHWLELPRFVDGKDGVISVAEAGDHIPFAIRRVYYIYQLHTPDAVRGKHAHKTLRQALFCINGTVEIDLDDGRSNCTVSLGEPHRGIYLGPAVWHVMRRFAQNCILMVLASEHFQESDYIRQYDQFLNHIRLGRL